MVFRLYARVQSHPATPRSTPNPTNQSARVLCVTRRTKRNSARSTTKPAIPIPNALTPSFFVILCHHHPYSIALRLIWRCAHGPTHREPPFIPPTEPGNAALVRAPSTRGCVSAGRWHLNRRRCAHVRLHGFDQFRPYGVRTRTARHHIHRCGSVAIVVVAVVVVEVSIQWNLMSASCLVRVASLKARCQRSAHAREHHVIAPARS